METFFPKTIIIVLVALLALMYTDGPHKRAKGHLYKLQDIKKENDKQVFGEDFVNSNP